MFSVICSLYRGRRVYVQVAVLLTISADVACVELYLAHNRTVRNAAAMVPVMSPLERKSTKR